MYMSSHAMKCRNMMLLVDKTNTGRLGIAITISAGTRIGHFLAFLATLPDWRWFVDRGRDVTVGLTCKPNS